MGSPIIHQVGIIMNGVTGRMGLNQHLRRSIHAIAAAGGLGTSDGEIIMPRPLLVGRNAGKLEAISREFGGIPFTTDLDSALSDSAYTVYFDAQTTDRRADCVRKAIRAGKHVYCEKPAAGSLEAAYELYRAAQQAGVKHGVVQDKLWLPGLLKFQALRDAGFFGRILSVRGEFGYWVFEGDTVPGQRPSWNYRKEDGGGIMLDMLCHWRYVLDNLFGAAKSVSPRTMRPTPRSSWKGASSRSSIRVGASACAATTCSRSRWTGPKAAPWWASATAGFSPMKRRLARYGIRTWKARSTISTNGRRRRSRPCTTTPSNASGSYSSFTW